MPSEYSFLDVAVLDAVRQRFAAGDAIAILSADLEQVIWANGPGAAMFGYPDIEAIIGASAQLPVIARRQIMATSGFPEIGSDRAIMVRLATGMTSRAVGFLASAVTMPDAEKAIMLAVPAAQTGSRSAGEIAARAISGFTEDGHFIAFVDARGNVEAASEGFSALGILPETLAALVADVAAESDRIVKRLVPGGTASYPAGLARLTEERHLLVVIDEDQLDDTAPAGEHPTQTIAEGAPAGDAASQPEQGRQTPTDEPGAALPTEDVAGSRPHAIADATVQTPTAANSDQPALERTPAQHDHWYFNAGEDGGQQAPRPAAPGPEAPAEPAALEIQSTSAATPTTVSAMDRAAAPVRFVWRTDAEGKFSALSPEFADIVGKPGAARVGRRGRGVGATLGRAPAGALSGGVGPRANRDGGAV
ncbi:PAS domain-containing sensor histidine kinase, partial [Mesorhizobium sp. M0322]